MKSSLADDVAVRTFFQCQEIVRGITVSVGLKVLATIMGSHNDLGFPTVNHCVERILPAFYPLNGGRFRQLPTCALIADVRNAFMRVVVIPSLRNACDLMTSHSLSPFASQPRTGSLSITGYHDNPQISVLS
jgi:hypothetical protein